MISVAREEKADVVAPFVKKYAVTWPFGLDLRTGAMTGGSGEQALLSAGCAQNWSRWTTFWAIGLT